MKNSFKITLLLLSMAMFTACGNKTEEKVEEPAEVVEEKVDEVPAPVEEETPEEVDKSSDFGEEVAGGNGSIDTMDMLSSRVESSDYIAIVKFENGEYTIVEQLKGEITPDEIMKVEGIEDGEELLIFVMKLDDMTMFTDEDSIVILDDAGEKYLEDTRELLK